MIVTVTVICLMMSLLCPWYFLAVFAGMLASFKKLSSKELIKISIAVFSSHFVAAILLDALAHGLVSQRVSGLFSLPFAQLVYLFPALPPLGMFLGAYWVVRSGRNVLKRRV